MEFLSAVMLMRDGKKVRRRCWNPGMYIYSVVDSEDIVYGNGTKPRFSLKQFEAIDWEEYKEKATLSDKIVYSAVYPSSGILSADDVKQAIELFIDSLNNYHSSLMLIHVKQKAKDMFGDTLC